MAYVNEGGELQAKGLQQLLIWLRQDLVGELDAINQYQAHIDNIDDLEVKELLSHIRDDEKEHVAEIMHLINRLDAMQKLKFATDHTVMTSERVASEETPEAGKEEGHSLTVGNMFGKK
jgi:uncharacterized protein